MNDGTSGTGKSAGAGAGVREAGERDREAVVRLLDTAFAEDPVSHWVFPDPARRRARHPLLVGAFVDIVLGAGRVDLAVDGTAAALWLPMPPGPGATGRSGPGDIPDDGDGDGGGDGDGDGDGGGHGGGGDGQSDGAILRAAVDPGNERVELMGLLTELIHPRRPHLYLWMIGVHPAHRGQGRGTALMRPVLDRCDREGTPVYLEASSARSRELYRGLGFAVREPLLRLPYGGPVMWPMWRDPRGSGGTTSLHPAESDGP
ncbi:GNAT family N-acetyltransferase [Streptomyces sp. NPDC000594]|uniref:GNAT family N-acetyltransferase n=1 Tax=Streptomyces sp. NPDC000594 TaxID=3154261 RepID=UPI003329CCCE